MELKTPEEMVIDIVLATLHESEGWPMRNLQAWLKEIGEEAFWELLDDIDGEVRIYCALLTIIKESPYRKSLIELDLYHYRYEQHIGPRIEYVLDAVTEYAEKHWDQ
jgi:hypothetical protein